MKTKSIILSVVASISLGAMFSSCSDMFSPNSDRHSYIVAGDTLYSYWGIQKSMQNIAERYVILGECRGDLVDGTQYLSDSIQAILNFDHSKNFDGANRYLRASDYYHVINSCNAYLAQADTLRKTGTNQPYMMKEYAQVEAIRAWTYLQLIQVYGKVPFYTKPLLSTDEINQFYYDQNRQMADADNLADLLEPYLIDALRYETLYGFPSYEKYGVNSTVCHATKAMIPVNLILGDLFLTKGDPESCKKAAQYYYNYLGNTQNTGHLTPGGALPNGYNYYGYQGEGMDKPMYMSFGGGTPWTESGAPSKSQESITCIPSSTNKLWGTVLRGVNELFGYSSEISVNTNENDTATTATVSLTPQYDVKQLAASNGYWNLCKDQTYEVLIGASGQTPANMILTVDPLVGDARQYWVDDVYQTYEGGLRNTEKFVTKQNPRGGFSTVATMIYRKSMVWLRYAEALNRAGYPSHAFAILKNGLCKNDSWFPSAEADYFVTDTAYYAIFENPIPGGVVRDTFPTYDPKNPSQYRTKVEVDEAAAEAGLSGEKVVYKWDALGYKNYTDESCSQALFYLDRREVLASAPFLNFDFTVFDGQYNSLTIPYRTSLYSRGMSLTNDNTIGSDAITVGIHSHGCGILPLSQMHNSTYNYVPLIQKYAAQKGLQLTKDDIYSGDYDYLIQDCIEDLIVEEEGLELAFEGTRFFDLMRVAHRRGDDSYLAKRVARRSGEHDAQLENLLSDHKNWYFPLPQ